jgi:hypothetical protein
MKTICLMATVLVFFVSPTMYAQNQSEIRKKMHEEMFQKESGMKTYLIEREIPNAGELSSEELKGISQKSNEVLSAMGEGIEWLHSYVTDDKVFCVYKAENEDLIREHAEKGGFPVNAIQELSTKIGPATAEQ